MIRRILGTTATLLTTILLIGVTGCSEKHQMLTDPVSASASPTSAGGGTGDGSGLDSRADTETQDAHARSIEAPTTITAPGNYQLTRDLVVREGDAIVIQASNVRLWLGEHTLTGPGNKTGRAIVIDGARNVLVRGGRIRSFGLGVALLGARGCRVRDVDIRGGDETADPANGNPPQIGIMLINSASNVIVDNHLRDLNLGLFVRGGESTRNLLHENVLLGGQHGLLGICYNPAPTGGMAGPHEDRVTANVIARFGKGISASQGSAHNHFIENTIRYFDVAWSDLNGTNTFAANRAVQIAR